jgi:hypothetical protein
VGDIGTVRTQIHIVCGHFCRKLRLFLLPLSFQLMCATVIELGLDHPRGGPAILEVLEARDSSLELA